MNTIQEPKPADLSRSAAEDLALCEAATPGPFFSTQLRTAAQSPVFTVQDGYGYCTQYGRLEDALHDATARTALPSWIRRAVAAEAERDELRARIAALEYALMDVAMHATGRCMCKNNADGCHASIKVQLKIALGGDWEERLDEHAADDRDALAWNWEH